MQTHKVQKLRRKLKSHNLGKLRLSVNRSNLTIYAQIIDDHKGITLVSASLKDIEKLAKTKTAQAAQVGEALAKKALSKDITAVYFDRDSYKFHGRVKALADAARAIGLKF